MVPGEMSSVAALTLARVHVNGHIREGGHGVEKIVADLFCNAVTFAGGHLTVNSNVQLGPLTMTHPANSNLINFHNTMHF
jgi:hypothetical protein